jgi:hypothetical protein
MDSGRAIKISSAVVSALMLAVLMTTSGCTSVGRVADILEDEVKGAPTQTSLSGAKLVMNTTLREYGRELPEHKRMHAIFTIRTTDGAPLPGGLRIDSVWLLDDTDIWSTPQQFESHPTLDQDRHMFSVVWPRDAGAGQYGWRSTAAEVVVRVVGDRGEVILLRSMRQPVAKS